MAMFPRMEIEVVVRQLPPLTVAYVRRRGPYHQMPEAFQVLFQGITEKGYRIAGPPMAVHYNNPMNAPMDELIWEIQIPIAGSPEDTAGSAQEVGVKRVPPRQAANSVHRGPYQDIANIYMALDSWLEGNSYQQAGPAEEVFISDPTATAEADLMIEVRVPFRQPSPEPLPKDKLYVVRRES